jgi:hypothetical protein
MGPGLEIREPPSEAVRPLAMMTAAGACAVNEQAPKIRITALTDSSKHGLASCEVLPRH